jgi:EpsI family protein
LRIAITGYLTLKVSREAAEGFFHGFSGWLIFMVSFVFLALLSGLIKVLRARILKQVPVHDRPDKEGTFSPFYGTQTSFLLVGAALLLGFWAVHATLASAQIYPDRKPFEAFPTQIGAWEGKMTEVEGELLEKELWADDYVQAFFKHEETGSALLLFVPYYKFQGTRHTAHSPVACIVGGGGFAPRSRREMEKTFPSPFGEVEIMQMVFEKGDDILLSNYWFQQRGRIISNEYANKWFMFWDSITRQRTDGALVRIEMPLKRGQDIESAQAVIDGFTRKLMKILPEYVPN